ncbi:hypothetical protein DID80_04230 [Candidatus Marinamargulisbacteria bacterium SCGC AAA071-K20]|nr:hypothetical protein DID80_04230 [Candidatus Marinamargulisbacteria bacterium SCGC AAA071-K20]
MKNNLISYLQMARPHHWIKNCLIFIPLLTSHRLTEKPLIIAALVLFFAQSLLSSSTYIINDLLDYKSDRNHPAKRNRPIASQKVSKRSAIVQATLFGGLSLYLGSLISISVVYLMLGYAVVSLLYSLHLKKLVAIDIILLSIFFIYRIFLGHLGLNIAHSMWLLAFCFFFFFGLAVSKRVIELLDDSFLKKDKKDETYRRGYSTEDLHILYPLGITSGLISILIYCLYINSAAVTILYSAPYFLWGNSIVFLTLLTRYWMLIGRKKVCADPVLFHLKDPFSYGMGTLIIVFIFLATFQ